MHGDTGYQKRSGLWGVEPGAETTRRHPPAGGSAGRSRHDRRGIPAERAECAGALSPGAERGGAT